MKQLLIINRIKVENANAVAGMTWGFPSIGHFLGFTHALGRKLPDNGCALGGCGIVCHEHQPHTRAEQYQPHRFCLTRNPLTSKGQTAPFNEEGRMHFTVSLIIEANLDLNTLYQELAPDDTELTEKQWLENEVRKVLGTMKLAGGTITDFTGITLQTLNPVAEEQQKQIRRILTRALPGFSIVNRSHLLTAHYRCLQKTNSNASLVETWMDFGGLRYRAEQSAYSDSTEKTEWKRVELPETGWLVPLMTGYRSIAPVLAPGNAKNSRDPTIPLYPVEAVYGVGQWISPHRIKDIEQIMWRYHYSKTEGYVFSNNYINNNESPEVM